MWHALLRDTRFFDLLYALDRDLADQTRSQGCPCGGRLDQAHYPRKPRGGPANLSPTGSGGSASVVPATDAAVAPRLLLCAFWVAACTSAS